MAKLLVIADDLTGAIDTGVQFAALGISVFVLLKDFSEYPGDNAAQVLVVNTSSRHLPPKAAYDAVYQVTRQALLHGVAAIYKKTDSGLRGNIGAEMQAVIDAAGGQRMAFIPSYPKMNRVVKNQVLYIDGMPVSQSVFGKDAFTPVTRDRVADIIAIQSDLPVYLEERPGAQASIRLYEAQTEVDMAAAAADAKAANFQLYAGCAGFAAYLPSIISLQKQSATAPWVYRDVLVVSGSISQLNLTQLSKAQEVGFATYTPGGSALHRQDYMGSAGHLEMKESILQMLEETGRAVVDVAGSQERVSKSFSIAEAQGVSLETARATVARNMGLLASSVLRHKKQLTLGVFGGDTLLEVLNAIDCIGILPVCEIEPGVVYSVCQTKEADIPLISKSGNFGRENLFHQLNVFLNRYERKSIDETERYHSGNRDPHARGRIAQPSRTGTAG